MTIYEALIRVTYPPRLGRFSPKHVRGWGETEDSAIAAALLEAIREGGLSSGTVIEVQFITDHEAEP